MSRRRDLLLPAAAFGALVAVGLLILVLLTDAVNSGREALEESLLTEVEASAQSQSAGLAGQLSSVGTFLAGRELDFEIDSDADRAEFADIANLLVDAGLRTGFFFTDDSGVITQGFQLQDRSVIGQPLDRPMFAEALRALSAPPDPETGALRGVWLPVAAGITIDVPTYAFVAPVRPEDESTLEGTLVFETDVVPNSSLNRQIAPLRHGETGEYMIFDSAGTIIASTNPSLVAQPIPDDGYLTATPGLRHRDGQVQVFADLISGWRMAFVQDTDEFEEGLAGPLQRAGGIVVAAFLLIGAVVFVALTRRLRAARDEQERLRRLNETQEEFISIVSHELRTPVAGVLGFLQTTIDHWDQMTDAERSGAVLRAASNARRLQGLTRDVLDSESVESGRMTYSMAPGDLEEEVTVAVDAARALYPSQRFDVVVEAGHVPVRIDADRIQQVLTNLLDNAVRVSPPERPIEVRLWTEGDTGCVTIRDHGPGVPQDMEDRVFEKFVRGRGPAVTGTGLGLYIARQILDAHEGSISVESAPGSGATFRVELPLIEAPVPS
jgi:signal transduction histidine kinase